MWYWIFINPRRWFRFYILNEPLGIIFAQECIERFQEREQKAQARRERIEREHQQYFDIEYKQTSETVRKPKE